MPIAHPDLATSAPRRPALTRRSLLGLVGLTLGLHLWLMDRWQALPAGQDVIVAAQTRAVDTIVTRSAETVAKAQPAADEPAPRPAGPPPTPAPLRPAPMTATMPPAPAPSPRPDLPPAAPEAPLIAPAPVMTPAVATAVAAERGSHDAAPELLPVALRAPSALPTTVPPSIQLDYRMSRGALVGRGHIDWRVDGPRYRMRLEARVPVVGRILSQVSEGRIDARGVAPERHTEQRLRRSERAVSFVRDDGAPRILFSAREGEAPLDPGAQDRLSWIAQLTARLDAPGRVTGERIVMSVAGVGGEVQRWVFTLLDRDEAGRWHLRREPDSPHDTRAEVWTLPDAPHWPQRLRLSESDGDTLELLLQPAAEPLP